MQGRIPAGPGRVLSALIPAATLVAVLILPAPAGAAALPQQSGHVDLLNQANVQLQGATASDHAGESVAPAGDVNDDGRDDVIVGAPNPGTGAAYVIFGRAGEGTVDLLDIGTGGNADGFKIAGAAAGDRAGISVDGVGDMNGDGKDDVIVGADGADGGGTDRGSAYVVFGKSDGATVDLASLGSGGFRIGGPALNGTAVGQRVAGAGDVNGDTVPDAVVASKAYDPPLPSLKGASTGAAWVVFGKGTTTTVDLDSLGAGGFMVEGGASGDEAGSAVDGADVNDDGKSDLLIGAKSTDKTVNCDCGSVYVVFGKATSSAVDLGSLGALGHRIDGAASSELAGTAVAAVGDANAGGKPDIAIGTEAGRAYLVFGESVTGDRDLANLNAGGSNPAGFLMSGAGAGTGRAVAGAGDINSDGKPDVLVGAHQTDDNGRTDSGSAFLVFGKASTANVNLAGITSGAEGFLIDGAQGGDQLGFSVGAAGDFNADGPADLVGGADLADRNSRSGSGAAYVVYGWETAPPETILGPGGPTGTVSTRTASFTFSGTDPSTPISFECRLDAPFTAHDQAFAPCSSPKAYASSEIVDDGQYTFSVRATDRFGNVDASPATRTWTVDAPAPTVQIDSGPSGAVNVRPATFTFSATGEPAFFFLCTLDAPGTAHDQTVFCASPKSYTSSDIVDDGQHTFTVRAGDALGNVGPVASRTWTLDTVAPGSQILTGPSGTVTSTTARFTFSSDSGTITQCKLDAAAFAFCYSPMQYAALAVGQHTFSVRATDLAGNTGAAASRTWTIQAPGTAPCSNTISGTSRDESLQGSALPERILGRGGEDLIDARGGQDCVLGGAGGDEIEGGGDEDEVSGEGGDDLLSGGGGADVVSGGTGRDVVIGDGGRDRLIGGSANDTIYAVDGLVDTVICGGGTDTVRADPRDRLSGCERVTRVRSP